MRCVFVGTGAFLGRIDGETRCAFWVDEPTAHGFDSALLISVNLSRSPRAALAETIAWEEIEVDDCFTGPTGALGGTTLGQRWPEIQITGLVYLEQRFIERLAPRSFPSSAQRGRAYEYTTTLYWPHIDDPRASRRYAGHHAEILEERGGLARVAVCPPGASNEPTAPRHKLWIDLSDPSQCDSGPRQLTTIGVGDMPKTGALFLIAGQIEHDTDI